MQPLRDDESGDVGSVVEESRSPAGLTAGQRAHADQLARRLVGELREATLLLAERERGASAMSRALGVDRATCQRIVQSTSRHDPGADTLVSLPGVQGLRLFHDALAGRATHGKAHEGLAGLRTAIDRFEEYLGELGLSQRGLKERLERDGAGVPGIDVGRGAADSPSSREALFRSAAGVMGRWSATTVQTSIIRPVPGDPAHTEWVRVRGLIGHAWREPAVPLELGGTANLQTGDQGPAFATLDGVPASGMTPGTLVADFCSAPLPRVVSKAAGARTVHVIDTDGHEGRGSLDIVTAVRSVRPDPHPAKLDPPVGEAWSLQNIPARRIVFDTFLHLDLARRCIPSVEVHLWMPDVARHAAARWSTRFPGGPRLELLGHGLRQAASPAYPRYVELLRHVLGRLSWDPEEYVGYRCELAFPLWRAGYCMRFDFGGSAPNEP